MSVSFKLPSLDENPILLAETRERKINEFITNLPFGDPVATANDLIDELQILNRQKVAFANRFNALELYRPAAIQVYQDLIPHFSNASLPLNKTAQAYADAAIQLWQEFAFGYKFALIDLHNKILNLNSNKTTAHVVQRTIHALKEINLIHYLGYRTPPAKVWAELHRLYFSAIQQSAIHLSVPDKTARNQESSVGLVYTEALLMALADPQHLSNSDILKTSMYLSNVSALAELRPLGALDSPSGVFLVSLNGDKPPTPFAKNKETPDSETDLLLITLNMARKIHAHITSLQSNVVPNDGTLPTNAVEAHYQDLLTRLIKNFGRAPLRVFSRIKKSDGIELGVGLANAHHLIQEGAEHFASTVESAVAIKPSRWQVLNVSAGGYSLRKFGASQAAVHVGDVVAMKNTKNKVWEIAFLRWAKVNAHGQLEIGLELTSPQAEVVNANHENTGKQGKALLLPEVAGLKLTTSLVFEREFCKTGQIVVLNHNNKSYKVLINQLVERTAKVERFQFSLA